MKFLLLTFLAPVVVPSLIAGLCFALRRNSRNSLRTPRTRPGHWHVAINRAATVTSADARTGRRACNE